MEKKILIIEDSQDDYDRVVKIIKKYNVDFYPREHDFPEFSKALHDYAQTKDAKLMTRLQTVCSNENPDMFLLDIGLSFNDSHDKTGLLVKELLLDKYHSGVPVCFLTKRRRLYPNQQNYIYKNSAIGLERGIDIEVMKKMNIPLQQSTHVKEDSVVPEKIELPKWFSDMAAKEEIRTTPILAFFMDRAITYVFFLMLVGLFILSPYVIIKKATEHLDVIHIAELAFLSFLPFLIVCGFYIFYNRSLRPYFIKDEYSDDDFEKSSMLMKLTKKLFISSLVSFLFIKLIELMYFEKGDESVSYFKEKYGVTDPLMPIYFVGGCILLLIIYYIFIDRHNNPKEHK